MLLNNTKQSKSHKVPYKSFKQRYVQMERWVPSFLCKDEDRDAIDSTIEQTHLLVCHPATKRSKFCEKYEKAIGAEVNNLRLKQEQTFKGYE